MGVGPLAINWGGGGEEGGGMWKQFHWHLSWGGGGVGGETVEAVPLAVNLLGGGGRGCRSGYTAN